MRIGVDPEPESGLGVIHLRAKPGNRAAPGPARWVTGFSVLLRQHETKYAYVSSLEQVA